MSLSNLVLLPKKYNGFLKQRYLIMDADHNQSYIEQNEETNNFMQHSLIEQQLEDGSIQNYYCVQCNAEFLTIDDFVKSHENIPEGIIEENDNEECQWETIDDLIVCDTDNANESIQNDGNEQIGFECISGVDGDSFKEIKEENILVEEMLPIKEEDEVGDNKYYCYDCRTLFRDLKSAENHDCPDINNVLEGEEGAAGTGSSIEDAGSHYICAYCENKFVNFQELQQHHVSCANLQSMELEAEENTNFKCSICFKMFQTLKALYSHTRMHKMNSIKNNDTGEQSQNGENSKCIICNTQFANVRSLKLHQRIHKDRPVRRIQEALPKMAAQKYNRLNHFFCEICNKSFEEKLMDVHKNMHQNIEEYICQTCNRQFKNKESYEMHQQLHSTTSVDNTTNPVINMGPTEAALRNAKKGVKSMHVANAKKTFPCQYCGHLFWRPHEKVRHEYVHTGEKPYPCEVCGKRFRVPYSLTLHLRTHTDIRPYVCSNCNKRFKSHSVYTHHLRTHLNERDYACDICGKTFRTTVQLYGHRNIHTKPFNCTVCNRPFASLFAVNSHMKTHEKGKDSENMKHTCNICGAVYGAVRALRAHKKEKHNLEANETSKINFDIPDEYAVVGTQSSDEHFEADEAAMLLLNAAAAEASVNNESLENLSVEQYYLNNGTVNGLENI